jgi:hypothetical protein
MSGQMAFSTVLNDTKTEINIEQLPKGQYVVKVLDGKKLESLMLVKK